MSKDIGLIRDDLLSLHRQSPGSICPARPQLPKHLVRLHKKRIFLQDAPDDDHRVGPQDVHDDLCTKLVQIVCSADGIIVLREDVVEPCLVLDDIVYTRPVFQRPLHVGDKPRQGKALRLSILQDFFN